MVGERNQMFSSGVFLLAIAHFIVFDSILLIFERRHDTPRICYAFSSHNVGLLDLDNGPQKEKNGNNEISLNVELSRGVISLKLRHAPPVLPAVVHSSAMHQCRCNPMG